MSTDPEDKPDSDEKLRELLGTFVLLARRHGHESQEVLEFAQAHREVPEFLDLAAVIVLAFELEESRESIPPVSLPEEGEKGEE